MSSLSPKAQDVLEEAKALSLQERAAIAKQLSAETISPPPPPRVRLRSKPTITPQRTEVTSDFQIFADLIHGRLEVRKGTHGAYECRLTLREVEPGKSQEKVRALTKEMNEKFELLPSSPWSWSVKLSDNRDLPSTETMRDLVFTFTPFVRDSEGRNPYFTEQYEGKHRSCQGGFLDERGFSWVYNDVVRVATGMFRLNRGFPSNDRDIGTVRDDGDLLNGMRVRTRRGIYSHTVRTSESGVSGSDFYGNDRPQGDLGAAGLSAVQGN